MRGICYRKKLRPKAEGLIPPCALELRPVPDTLESSNHSYSHAARGPQESMCRRRRTLRVFDLRDGMKVVLDEAVENSERLERIAKLV